MTQHRMMLTTVIASLGMISTPPVHAAECSILRAQACATEEATGFRGAIIVPGSDAANRAVAQSGGCDGCEWTLVIDCDRNDVDSDTYVECGAARCEEGTTYRLYLQRPGDRAPVFVDTICLTPARRIVTAAELAVDVERHLTNLRPPVPGIETRPKDRAVTKLATYFAANGAATDRTTLDVVTAAGPATLRISIRAGRYVWDFGDGARCETTEPGGGYDGAAPGERCDDRIAHVYPTAGDREVTLRATWHGTYTFDVGYGPVGPLPIPGNGVQGAAATRTVAVRDARAQLVAD